MSNFALILLFIKAFFRTWKATFNQMTVEELNHVYQTEINTNVFNESYYRGLYRILVRQRVDSLLDNIMLEQITGPLYMPSASTSFAWIMKFSEFVELYITRPEVRETDKYYIPSELKNYFIIANDNISNLEYLVQDNGICAVLPYLEDVIAMLEYLTEKINSIEDEITRYYFFEQLRPYNRDIRIFMTRTIEWINTYDRTR